MADPGYQQNQNPPGYGEGTHPMQPMNEPMQTHHGQVQPYGAPQSQVVVMQPPTTTIITQAPPPRPSDYLILAIFVTICCNLVFGIIAIILSVMSKSAADSGDYEGARTKGKISMGLSIAGIISTIVIVIIVVVYYVVVVAAFVGAVSNSFKKSG